jgi:transaldolase
MAFDGFSPKIKEKPNKMGKHKIMKTIQNTNKLKIKIFSDGADKKTMLKMNSDKLIRGLTTNPTLMKKAGIKNYKYFCKDILKIIDKKPISFEVFADDFDEMYRQAIEISKWGRNVYVKIPITNTKGHYSLPLIKSLSGSGVKVNVTAIMTTQQVSKVFKNLNNRVPSYISVFAGRIADTGIDPIPIMKKSLRIISESKKCELIWASPRELLNVFQADKIGCNIITATSDIISKLNLVGYNLEKYSLDTVKMFYNDSINAGYKL